jgi:hypothetical protein
MSAALAIAMLAAAGIALAQVGGDAELRAVSAPARAVEAREGALLAAREFRRPAQLMMVRPGSLRRVGRPLRLEEDFIHDFALSPDGTRVAIGSEMRARQRADRPDAAVARAPRAGALAGRILGLRAAFAIGCRATFGRSNQNNRRPGARVPEPSPRRARREERPPHRPGYGEGRRGGPERV